MIRYIKQAYKNEKNSHLPIWVNIDGEAPIWVNIDGEANRSITNDTVPVTAFYHGALIMVKSSLFTVITVTMLPKQLYHRQTLSLTKQMISMHGNNVPTTILKVDLSNYTAGKLRHHCNTHYSHPILSGIMIEQALSYKIFKIVNRLHPLYNAWHRWHHMSYITKDLAIQANEQCLCCISMWMMYRHCKKMHSTNVHHAHMPNANIQTTT